MLREDTGVPIRWTQGSGTWCRLSESVFEVDIGVIRPIAERRLRPLWTDSIQLRQALGDAATWACKFPAPLEGRGVIIRARAENVFGFPGADFRPCVFVSFNHHATITSRRQRAAENFGYTGVACPTYGLLPRDQQHFNRDQHAYSPRVTTPRISGKSPRYVVLLWDSDGRQDLC